MNAYQTGQKLLCGDYYQYTPTGASQFKKAGRWTTVPKRGDIAFFYNASLGRIAHTGIVVSAFLYSSGWEIVTIEGNTSSAAQDRNGGEVRKKTYTGQRIGGGSWFEGFGVPDYISAGITADQVISVAESQIGYEEKKSAADLEDFHANAGKANYTKYSRFCSWFASPAQWCGQFVSWCIYTACANARDYQSFGWVQQDNGAWNYRKPNGKLAADEWQFIDGRWYVFDNSGRMITGWFEGGGLWYYLGEDGGMLSDQWLQYSGSWYYLTSSGAMAVHVFVKDKKGWCYVGQDGTWNGVYQNSYGPGAEVIG